MTTERLTAADLDYIQRTGFAPPPFRPGAPVTEAPVGLRTLARVAGVGRLDKGQRATAGEDRAVSSADLLVGLYNYKVPVAFQVSAGPGRTSVSIGTWLPAADAGQAAVGQNAALLDAALATLYPAVDVGAVEPVTGNWPLGGLVLGIPTAKAPDVADGALPYDRLLRALGGGPWAALVLAQPVDETVVRDLRLQVINEMRAVQTAAKHDGVPSPLADHYGQLLGLELERLADAQGAGAWRTTVYLLGDHDSYHRLASLWRGVFSGTGSRPEPVRVWDRDEVPQLATGWAMLDPVDDGSVPPGHYRQPFQHQTLLTSSQLAAYVHFPNVETGGFAVSLVPDFDVVAPSPGAGALVVGQVVERQRVSPDPYGLSPGKLTRHAFVAGVTGSGKTNTLFHLLRQVAATGVPFLVLEPAKTEYRVLLRDEVLGRQLQVFTLGDETTSPFRLNPFEVPEGTPVAVHLDLLRSAFNASFGMWTPLPQVLEAALHAVYLDRGWDVTANTNHRLDDPSHRSDAFPTLTDLVRKVEEIVPALGYEERVTGDIRAALRTRLDSLRTGGKGRMLDVRSGFPVDVLLGRPTVLELEGMGDDEDKAFVIGLLMARLAEHRRAEGDADGLRHLLVIEEAHRLLANPGGPRREEGESDVRGKAVETFTNLLSEIRAYGQGVVVADQVPVKLAPDVVKNTNLKLAHRIVAGDDRDVLAAAMAMTPRQARALATLPVGRAAVFNDGEDAPLLVQVPPAKGGSGTWPTDAEVRAHMAGPGSSGDGGTEGASPAALLPSGDCDERCTAEPQACELARRLVDDPRVRRTFSRLVLSAVTTPGGLDRTWPDLVAVVEPQRPSTVDTAALMACVSRHAARGIAERRGARASWTYRQTAALADLIDALVLDGREGDPDDAALAVRVALLALQGDVYGPFPGCPDIWGTRPGPCLCRHPVAELAAEGGFAGPWEEARRADRESIDGGRVQAWDVAQDAAYQLVEFPTGDLPSDLVEQLADVARCVALCCAQQLLAAEDWAHPATQRRVIAELLEESGHLPEAAEAAEPVDQVDQVDPAGSGEPDDDPPRRGADDGQA